MTLKTMPTPGPWWAVLGDDQPSPMYRGLICMIENSPRKMVAVCTGEKGDQAAHEVAPEEWEANARLIAAAGTVAHEIAQQGYDPIEAIKAWPAILAQLEADTDKGWMREWIARAAGKEGG